MEYGIVKISYTNWKSSHDKWVRAVEKTLKHERFFNNYGFKGLRIITVCGYCYEIRECCYCILYSEEICSSTYRSDTLFWQYIKEMQKSIISPERVDWPKALDLAQRIRDAIAKDRPPKKRQRKIKK